VPTKAPFWPSDTVGAEGSGGVSDAISATEYSIGYIESGHGQALGLAEVALQNKDGNYLTAADADIGSAVMQIMSSIPNADGDWDNDNLSLLDLGGEKTWPNHRVFVHVHSKGFDLPGSLWPSRQSVRGNGLIHRRSSDAPGLRCKRRPGFHH